MKAIDIKNRICEIASHFTFTYNGKNCGVDPFSTDKFEMWCGENEQTVHNIDDVMDSKFFDGKSLNEIANEIIIVDF